MVLALVVQRTIGVVHLRTHLGVSRNACLHRLQCSTSFHSVAHALEWNSVLVSASSANNRWVWILPIHLGHIDGIRVGPGAFPSGGAVKIAAT